jgi:tripartite-type tricarboxylate transporter receptor subunit TctC
VYGDADVQRLTFIRRCREFGFAIDQVRSLVALVEDPQSSCMDARDLAQAHLAAVRAKLAVTTAEPSELLPGLPVVANYLPGYEASGWYGVGAPKGIAVEIIDRLNHEITAALADLKIKVRFVELGVTVLAGSPADFGKLLVDETEKWAKVVKFAGIKPE